MKPLVANATSSHPLDLKIPPGVLVIAFAILMSVGAAFTPTLNFHIPFHAAISWALGSLGLIACTLGFLEFRRAKTTVNPTTPQAASSLVASGIYRRTRNPMYLGFFLILVAWAVARANIIAFLLLPAFILYMNRFQIAPEERALAKIFGDDFKSYCSAARRWI